MLVVQKDIDAAGKLMTCPRQAVSKSDIAQVLQSAALHFDKLQRMGRESKNLLQLKNKMIKTSILLFVGLVDG